MQSLSIVQFMDIHPGECWLNNLLQGSYVALGDVHDVDVVAAACTYHAVLVTWQTKEVSMHLILLQSLSGIKTFSYNQCFCKDFSKAKAGKG